MLAEYIRSSRTVALTLFRGSTATPKRFAGKARLVGEAKAMARTREPNVVAGTR